MTNRIPKKKPRLGVDVYGRNDLHNAVIENDLEKSKKLIKKDIDMNAQDDNGWTALHFAVQENSTEIVQLLLDSGAMVDLQDIYGNTPLFKALFSFNGEDGTIIKKLLAKGADPKKLNNSGVSPQELAQQVTNKNLKQFFT